jgi:polysaccharide biosynthesis transport protein
VKITDLLRLLKKHRVLLLATPIVLAILVIFLTKNPSRKYASETTLFTGIASGSSVELDKSQNFFVANTAFDNLINIIKSRETQQEVAIRLLAEHLMLVNYDPKYISKESYKEFLSITPAYIFDLIAEEGESLSVEKGPKVKVYHIGDVTEAGDTIVDKHETEYGFKYITDLGDTLTCEAPKDSFSFDTRNPTSNDYIFPPSINKAAYEQTVQNLENFMAKNDTNFVYKLLNYTHPHYSIKAISAIEAQRIGTSDLVKLKFESNDPGICQQTLAIFTEVCLRNNKVIKENHSDAVVRYFEYELKKAQNKLKEGEAKLLQFNEQNNIINYYEQSKAVAIVKEDLEVDYNKMEIELAGTNAAIKRIEEKLQNQSNILPKSTSIIEKRNQLGEINAKIATIESVDFSAPTDKTRLIRLKKEAQKLKDDIRDNVNQLYSYGHSMDGIPNGKLLNDWIDHVVQYEDTKAGMEVQKNRINQFQGQYEQYAPAGANIKRIEREINVSEQEYLEILHGLNEAKLRLQDVELSSNIKAIDPPFFPLTPNPSKRKWLVVIAAIFGFLLVSTIVFTMEYFDNTLRNPEKATARLQLNPAGVFPKIFLKTGISNFPFVVNRLLEIILQNIEFHSKSASNTAIPQTFLFFSILEKEGKTVLTGNLALKMKKKGKKVLYLNYAKESLLESERLHTGYINDLTRDLQQRVRSNNHFSLVSWLLGYGDKRVDENSAFLQDPDFHLADEEYQEYSVNAGFYEARNYQDLLMQNDIYLSYVPDYVFIELPPVLHCQYPANLMASESATSLLICRSNRTWSLADEGMLNNIRKASHKEPLYLLNGVESPVIESFLGELPKKQSRFKKLFLNPFGHNKHRV